MGFSITGGHVYRGQRSDSCSGVYIFGDYSTRRVWGLQQNEKVKSVVEIATAPDPIASFGLAGRGEIYSVTYKGLIYHIDLASTEYSTDND